MRAIQNTTYGSPEVLQLTEIEKPIPKNNEVRIKIYAASVTAADTMMRKGKPYIGRLFIGLTKPKNPIPGTGFAGEIEAIGSDVREFKKGDKVFGERIFGQGTYAAYTCVAEDGVIALMPNNMTYQEGASICDGVLTSLNFLREVAGIKQGQKILINGASGSLGTAAIQLAKYFGAEVTGVCSTSNFEMVKSLGADKVIDYQLTDFTKNGLKYDIIYDTVGKLSFSRSKISLNNKGVFITPVLNFRILLQAILTNFVGTKKAKFSATGVLPIPMLRKFLKEINELIIKGKVRAIIDRSYTLDQVVEAHNYVDKGHKKGNVVLNINIENDK